MTTMRLNSFRLGIVTLTLLGISFWSGCISQKPEDSDQQVKANLDAPFQLQLNQAAVLESEKLKIRFSSVTEDSRCPSDAVCIWAGRATIVVNIFKNEQNRGVFSLSTEGDDVAVAIFDKYSITLIEVEPYPTTNQTIALSEYIVTLVVSKAA